jgi:hypothetical protein
LFLINHFEENLKANYLIKSNTLKKSLYDKLINIDNFYFFFNFFFDDSFKFNIYLYDLSESYVYDLDYIKLFVDIYNLYFYHSLDFFFLLFNMEALKYEHEQYLTPEKD